MTNQNNLMFGQIWFCLDKVANKNVNVIIGSNLGDVLDSASLFLCMYLCVTIGFHKV